MAAPTPSGGWREEITEENRKGMITDMYHELLRISGENDKQKVWRSAAKFELMLWLQSTDQMTYMSKLQKKIASLKKKVQSETAGVPQQTPAQQQQQQQQQAQMNSQAQAQMAAAAGMFQNPVNMANAAGMANATNAAAIQQYNQTLFLQQQAELLKKQQEQHRLNTLARQQQAQQAVAAAQAAAAAQATQAAQVAAQAAAAAAATTANTSASAPGPTTTNPLATQQQPQVLMQLQQQYQQQKSALTTAQHNEMQRLRQAQLLQQNQVSTQQHQNNVPQEARVNQMTQLQQQHLNARNKLSAEHKAKQAQLLRQHQQTFLQQKALLGHTTMSAAAANNANASASSGTAANNSATMNANAMNTAAAMQQAAAIAAQTNNQVTAAQALAAQKFQQQQRALSRQNSLTSTTPGPTASTASTPPVPAANAAGQLATAASGDALSYGDKLKQLKTKYWEDLVVVCREFTRMAMQKPAGESQQALQQQERIKNFLQNLKRIMTLLNQDPTKLTSNNRNDLDRVEQHIERQVMPILSRLKSDKAKQREDPAKTETPVTPAPTAGPTPADLQRQTVLMQQAAQLELQRQNHLAQVREHAIDGQMTACGRVVLNLNRTHELV
ncbi:hypothetical protein, variant 1 [Aphanomyces invadans]|uniref:Mediator complex subunit 15 KIX domain-containing protein n=1 Tax=Aphanomyces invadans TaxID=157072 RepID=A0A024TPI5_9STRA|nr:hypothetical protein, variant 1 [Aphanomyces invadans]ETV96070.1 hypothetical protein, variant 1 [Aphanomyces invadans]|eukprot:XP_008875382.1 hypothetical protein, variant 1 [Aphanomyces invadans]